MRKKRKFEVVSTGQSQSEQAAWMVAEKFHIECGGEQAPGISQQSPIYARAVNYNIANTDGTLILAFKRNLDGRHPVMRDLEKNRKKPFLILCLENQNNIEITKIWLKQKKIQRLNITGNSDFESSVRFLRAILKPYANHPRLYPLGRHSAIKEFGVRLGGSVPRCLRQHPERKSLESVSSHNGLCSYGICRTPKSQKLSTRSKVKVD